MPNGVFDERLQQERRHQVIEQPVRNVDRHNEAVTESDLLDVEVTPHGFELDAHGHELRSR
ncbi:hypothetical protein D3C83_165740 [compost metagenome]